MFEFSFPIEFVSHFKIFQKRFNGIKTFTVHFLLWWPSSLSRSFSAVKVQVRIPAKSGKNVFPAELSFHLKILQKD